MRVAPYLLCALVLAAAARPAAAQPAPVPPGRIVEVGDGDVVIMPRSARAAVVARWTGQGRLVFDAARNVVLLLLQPAPDMAMRDGEVLFNEWHVSGAPALPARWEGPVTVDEYRPIGRGPAGLSLEMDRSTVFFGHWPESFTTVSRPEVVVDTRAGRSGGTAGTLDALEAAWRTGGAEALNARGGPRAAVRLEGRATGAAGVPSAAPQGTPAPLRVGGTIKVPTKIGHADPVYPQDARDARVQGVVILEVTIDPAGVPSDVRVLRSIPLLDAAAVDAVKQWRYEPTLLNGVAVPVILTVTVNFTLGPQ